MLDLLREDLNYKVKIDVPNIVEIISETFDSVLNHMLPGMLVFGGALRDIIAGFGLHYDLDIATSSLEGKEFIHYLETSSKWMEECVITQYKEQVKVMESKILDIISPHSMENGMLDLNRNFSYNTKPKSSNYGKALNVRTFINSSGQKLQIITGKSDLFTLEEDPPIIIAKTVDFICCGLIMDTDGNVYEVIEGAKDDCIKRILRVNKNVNIRPYTFSKRIEKFTTRGWKSQINLTKIKYKQARLKKVLEKKEAERQPNKSLTNYIYKHTLSSGETQIIINTSRMQTFKYCKNSNVKTLELFYSILRNCHLNKKICSCRISSSYDEQDHVIILLANKDANVTLEFENALLHKEHEVKLLSSGTGRRKLIDRKMSKCVGELFKGNPHRNKVLDLSYQYSSNSDSSRYSFTYNADQSAVSVNTCQPANCSANASASSSVTLPKSDLFEEKIEWASLERSLKMPTIEETVTGLEVNNTKPTAKTKLVENNSNLEVTKKEKMGIGYRVHLIDNRAQITKMEMDKISKHFTGKQIKSLNTEEKKH